MPELEENDPLLKAMAKSAEVQENLLNLAEQTNKKNSKIFDSYLDNYSRNQHALIERAAKANQRTPAVIEAANRNHENLQRIIRGERPSLGK